MGCSRAPVLRIEEALGIAKEFNLSSCNSAFAASSILPFATSALIENAEVNIGNVKPKSKHADNISSL